MKRAILKHPYSVTRDDLPIGSATDAVLYHAYVEKVSGALYIAMFSDIVKYSLEGSAIWVFWKMVMGGKVNISLVMYLWLSAFIVDALVQESLFIVAAIKEHKKDMELVQLYPENGGYIYLVNIFWHAACPIFRFLSVASTVCLFFKYSSLLQTIVDSLNSRTALFDLYYNSEQPLKMPAGSLGIDFSLLGIIILFTWNGAMVQVASVVCRGFYYLACCLFIDIEVDKKVSLKNIKDGSVVRYSSLFTKRSLPPNSLNFISFEFPFFPIFLMAMRAIYSADHVEFLHQLSWKTPMFYFIFSLVMGAMYSVIFLLCVWAKFSSKHHDEGWYRFFLISFFNYFPLMIGSIIFMKYRESDPLWAIQFFFGVLILEKVLTLFAELARGIEEILKR